MQNLPPESVYRPAPPPSASGGVPEEAPRPGLGADADRARALLAALEEQRRLLETERRARAAAEAAADWLSFLENASRALSSCRGYDAALAAAADLAVPRLADRCVVHLLQPDGSLRSLPAARSARADEVRAPAPGSNDASLPGVFRWVRRVARTGSAERAETTDARRALRELAARAGICVPLVVRESTLGAMLLLATRPGRSYAEDDVRRARALADHVALAIDNARLHEGEQEARRRAERMQELSAALSAALTREEVGAAVMRVGIAAMGAYAGVVALLTRGGAELEILTSIGYQGCMQAGHRWPLGEEIPLAEATRSGKPIFLRSAEAWGGRYLRGRTPAPGRSAAWAAIPLRLPGEPAPVGSLLWTFDRPQPFGDDDRALFEALARQCAQALERARLHEAEQRARMAAERAADRLNRLQAVTAALSEALTSDQVAAAVVDQGIVALGAQAGAIALLNAEETELHVVRAVGYDPQVRERFRVVPLSASFSLVDCVRERRPVFLRDVAERDARYPHLADVVRANGGGAMAAVPLMVNERILGALGLNFPESLEVNEEDLSFILALAQQCAQALDRARLYEAERRARAEAEQANLAKAQFLSTMSHELRTPLNAIGGYTDLLEMEVRGPVSELQRADLQRIRRNQRHLLNLINDVLNFARVEAGHLELSVREVPVAALLEDLEQLVLPQLQAKRLRFSWSEGPEPLRLSADPDKVQQILLNLVSNAIKFSPEGGRIEVLASGSDTEVTVRVRDEGPGIPTDQLERIFDPFVQLGRGLTSSHEGAGLGLAISRDLARAMGGDLCASSEPGSGAVFSLALPRA